MLSTAGARSRPESSICGCWALQATGPWPGAPSTLSPRLLPGAQHFCGPHSWVAVVVQPPALGWDGVHLEWAGHMGGVQSEGRRNFLSSLLVTVPHPLLTRIPLGLPEDWRGDWSLVCGAPTLTFMRTGLSDGSWQSTWHRNCPPALCVQTSGWRGRTAPADCRGGLGCFTW